MIRLLRLRTVHFCNLPDRWWDFAPGLQLIRGPNEAGKTSLRRALTLALYGDAATREQTVRALQRWNEEGMCLELEFEHEGDPCRLVRDFKQRRNSLELPDGKQLRSKEQIRAQLNKMLLIPTERAFLATACMSHQELRIENPGEVQSLIERIICGTGEDVEKLIGAIEKAHRARHRGMDRLAREPGILRQIRGRFEQANLDWAEADRLLREAQEAAAKLGECEQDLADVEGRLKQLKQHKQRHEELRRAQKDCERFAAELVEIEDNLEQAAQLGKRRECLEQGLQRERARLQSLGADVDHADKGVRLASELADTEADVARRAAQWDLITGLTERIGALRAEEDALLIRRDEAQNACLHLPEEIAGLEEALAQDRAAQERREDEVARGEDDLAQIRTGLADLRLQEESLEKQFGRALPSDRPQSLRTSIAELTRAGVGDEVHIQIHAEQSLEVGLSSDGAPETRLIAPVEHVFKREATVRVPGILLMRVENRGRVAAELAARQQELQTLLEEYGCQDWEAYEKRQTEAERLGRQFQEVQAQIRALQQEEARAKASLTGLRASLSATASAKQIEQELARKGSALSGILQRAGVSQPEDLRPLLERFATIETQRALNQDDLAGALAGARAEDVKRLLDQAQKRARKLQDALDGTPNPGWTAGELETHRQQLQISQQKASNLEQELLTVRGKLSMLDSAKLDDRRNSLRRDLVTAQAVVSQNEQFQLAPSDVLRMENEIASLEEKIRQYVEQRGRLQERAQQEDLRERKLRAEEEMDWLRRRMEIEQFRDEVDADVARLLDSARERAVERLRRHLPERSGRFLAIITEGRYQQMDGEGLGATVFSSEKGAVLADYELSSGTADQLYLAKRFAALTALFDRKLPPLLLDDILVHCDSKRRAAIVRLLKELADETQILLFTCHDFPEYAGLPTLSLP